MKIVNISPVVVSTTIEARHAKIPLKLGVSLATEALPIFGLPGYKVGGMDNQLARSTTNLKLKSGFPVSMFEPVRTGKAWKTWLNRENLRNPVE